MEAAVCCDFFYFFLKVFLHCSVLLGSYILSLCSSDFLPLLYGVHRLNIPTAVSVCSREWSPVLASMLNFRDTALFRDSCSPI